MTIACPRCEGPCTAAEGIAFPWLPQVRPAREVLNLPPEATGRGVTIAVVDSGFYPHPDLTRPVNRIRLWADAAHEPVRWGAFDPGELPRWPGWDQLAPRQWHGLMCSAVAAGNGWLTHGLLAGPACEADVVLVQVLQPDGRIGNGVLARALGWLADRARDLSLRVVSLSVGGDPGRGPAATALHAAVRRLAAHGVTVLAAAGNDGHAGLVPPASSPAAITIGGFEPRVAEAGGPVLWRSNWGRGKPEVIAPAAWIPAPLLPGTEQAAHAQSLWSAGDGTAMAARKFLTPHEHHVDGTSVAVSLAAGVAACVLQTNPRLSSEQVKRLMASTAGPIPGPRARQGSGALDAGRAVRQAPRAG
jgi:serine protease AprX